MVEQCPRLSSVPLQSQSGLPGRFPWSLNNVYVHLEYQGLNHQMLRPWFHCLRVELLSTRTILQAFSEIFLKRFHLFLETGKGRGKRGRETSMCVCLACISPLGTGSPTQACVLAGNRTGNPLVCSLHSIH